MSLIHYVSTNKKLPVGEFGYKECNKTLSEKAIDIHFEYS